jgi:hypothetical protein
MSKLPASAVPTRSNRLLLLLLTITLGSLGTARAVGPNQQAAIDKCKGTFVEQKRSCHNSSNYAACLTMHTEKYNQCMSDAQTVVGMDPGSPKPPKTDSTNKIDPQAKQH